MSFLLQKPTPANTPFPLAHTSCDLMGQRAYVIAGLNQKGLSIDVFVLETIGLGSWSKVLPSGVAPKPRFRHTISVVGAKIYLLGGSIEGELVNEDISILNTALKSWSKIKTKGVAFNPREGHTAVTQGNNIFVFGGVANKNSFNEFIYLDTIKAQWSVVDAKGTPPSPRHSHTSVLIKDTMLVFGGSNDSIANNEVHIFNFFSSTWENPKISGDVPQPRSGHVACVIKNKMYIFGGVSETGEILSDTWVFDIDTITWTNIPTTAGSRHGHSVVSIGSRIFIMGGKDQTGTLIEKGDAFIIISTDKLASDASSSSSGSGKVLGTKQTPTTNTTQTSTSTFTQPSSQTNVSIPPKLTVVPTSKPSAILTTTSPSNTVPSPSLKSFPTTNSNTQTTPIPTTTNKRSSTTVNNANPPSNTQTTTPSSVESTPYIAPKITTQQSTSPDLENQLREALNRAEKAEAEVKELKVKLQQAETLIEQLENSKNQFESTISSSAPTPISTPSLTPGSSMPPPMNATMPPPPPPMPKAPPKAPPPPPMAKKKAATSTSNTPTTSSPTPSGGRDALLSAISTAKLKKTPVEPRPEIDNDEKAKSSASNSGGGNMSIAAMAMAKKASMKTTGNLDKLLLERPSKQELVERHIIPAFTSTLKKQQIKDELEPKIESRPPRSDLENKGILQKDVNPPSQDFRSNLKKAATNTATSPWVTSSPSELERKLAKAPGARLNP